MLQEITGEKFAKDQEWVDWYRKLTPGEPATAPATPGGVAMGAVVGKSADIEVSEKDIGKMVVVVARASGMGGGPTPPAGMMTTEGEKTVMRGVLRAIGRDEIVLGFPPPETYGRMHIPRGVVLSARLEEAATRPATAPGASTAPAPGEPVADWEAKADQPITIEGTAYRDLSGIVYLRPAGNTYPYAIELPKVLADLKGGQLLSVRVSGTLHVRKATVSQEEVDAYRRDLATGNKPMRLDEPRVGAITRSFWIADATVTRIGPAHSETAPAPGRGAAGRHGAGYGA